MKIFGRRKNVITPPENYFLGDFQRKFSQKMFYKVDFQTISDHIQPKNPKFLRLRRSKNKSIRMIIFKISDFPSFDVEIHVLKYFLRLKSFELFHQKIFWTKKTHLWKPFSPCSQLFENTFFAGKLALCLEIWSKHGVEKNEEKIMTEKYWRKNG